MIKLISACNAEPAYLEMAALNQASIQKYCRRHSLPFAFHNIPPAGRPASWYKLKLLREEMEKSEADYYLWIDVDALIFNLDFDLPALTRSGKEMYLSRDDTNINCGVWLLRRSKYALDLLDTLWNMTHCLNHPWWEQQALIELIAADHQGLRQKIGYVPQHVFNAYNYPLYQKRHEEGEFNAASFIVHYPSLPLAVRLREMTLVSRYLRPWRRFGLRTGRFVARCARRRNSSASG